MKSVDKKQFKQKVKQDTDLKTFLADRDRKEGTKIQYEHWISEYCYYHQMTPSELIDEAIKDEQNPKIHSSRRKLKSKILSYKEHMKKEKELSPKVIQNRITIIKAFYNFFDIELPTIDNSAKIKRRLETDEDLPSNKQIKEALKYSNKKYRAIISLQASSGMRKAEIRNLKYYDFLFSIRDYVKLDEKHKYNIKWIRTQLNGCKDCIPAWKVFSSKTETEYVTFCTLECLNYILDSLEQRQEGKNPITSEDDYLFGGIKRKNNLTGQISDEAYMKYFQRLNKELNAGKNKNQPKHRFFTSHQLRRYFATTLDEVIRREKVDDMLGHVKGEVKGSYFKTKKEDLLKHYKKGLKLLTIDKPEIIDITSEKVHELEEKFKEEIKSKDAEIADIKKSKHEEITALKHEIERQNTKINAIDVFKNEMEEKMNNLFIKQHLKSKTN